MPFAPNRTRVPGLLLVGLAVAGTFPAPAFGQAVEGRVIDADTEEPVSGAGLVLRGEDEVVAARAETGEDGRFFLPARSLGAHTLEVRRLGYADPAPQALTLEREVLEVEVRLSRSPIELAPITVTGSRRDVRHDATFEGALVRHRLFPGVGSRRVVLRSEAVFRSAITVSDILRRFQPLRGCTIVFSNGQMARSPEWAAYWLSEASTEDLEAVEFYRWWSDAPLDLKDAPSYVDSPSDCSVVALWPRVDPPAREALTWRRALSMTGVLAAVFFVSQAF